MSLDLNAILDTAAGPVEALIRSCGTLCRIGETAEGRGQGTTDPETLVHTPTAPTWLYTEEPVFLAPMGTSDLSVAGGNDATATPVQTGMFLGLLLPKVADLTEQHVLEVTASRDPRLVGRMMDVVTILDSSAGMLRVFHALPRTLGPGAT